MQKKYVYYVRERERERERYSHTSIESFELFAVLYFVWLLKIYLFILWRSEKEIIRFTGKIVDVALSTNKMMPSM